MCVGRQAAAIDSSPPPARACCAPHCIPYLSLLAKIFHPWPLIGRCMKVPNHFVAVAFYNQAMPCRSASISFSLPRSIFFPFLTARAARSGRRALHWSAHPGSRRLFCTCAGAHTPEQFCCAPLAQAYADTHTHTYTSSLFDLHFVQACAAAAAFSAALRTLLGVAAPIAERDPQFCTPCKRLIQSVGSDCHSWHPIN